MFVGLERNIESIRSLEGADIVWIEEARTISAKSMEILLPTVRAAGIGDDLDLESGHADRSGRRLLPQRQAAAALDRHQGQLARQSVLRTDRNAAGDGGAEARQLRDRYQHVWEGEYDISYETKVFTNVRIGRPDIPANTPPYYGMDFGFGSDPSLSWSSCSCSRSRSRSTSPNEASGRVTMDQLPHWCDR